MTDEDLEQVLHRYVPASPSDGLRERVLAPPLDSPGAWPWLVAAGVLLCITIGAQAARCACTVSSQRS